MTESGAPGSRRRYAWFMIAATLLACAGCSAVSPDNRQQRADFTTVAEDDAFYILRLKQGQSLEDVAESYLGGPHAMGQLHEVNARKTPLAGDLVAVPKQAINPTGVYRDGYRSVPILCYHQFTSDHPPEHKLELNASDFEAQLRYLRDGGFQTLSFAELRKVLQLQRPMPEKAVVLTIDDGYGSVYDVAWPLLKKYGMQATLFIYTDFIGAGAALSWEQLREMRDSGLIAVESHGKSHASLARTPDDRDERSYRTRLAAELSASEAAFMANLGAAPDYMSYPYGNSSRVIATMLKENGYGLAATVTRGHNSSFVDPFLLHRTMIYDGHSISDFAGFVRGYIDWSQP